MAGEGTGVWWTGSDGEEHTLPADVKVKFATRDGYILTVDFSDSGSIRVASANRSISGVAANDGPGLKMMSKSNGEWIIDGATWW